MGDKEKRKRKGEIEKERVRDTDRETEIGPFETRKPTPSATLPSTRPHLLQNSHTS